MHYTFFDKLQQAGIQGFKQDFRVSFSAQRTKDSIKLSFFCAFRGRVRDHIDNPSKPPFDKGGFAWSGKRDSPRSDPELPPVRGLGGVNKSSREMPANAGSWLVFRLKTKGWLNASLFDFRIIRLLPSAPNTIYWSK